ncbi:hypothetical protein [Nonomuraea angiospora]|uniref:hypothetical protein n=1 Tax=Nonomuraea angiospora TaxID=46172 RepID=UPI0029A5AB3A|nr:hypothetical protein [Nonomuraea angiospora]MDX3109480.1 hypothetical protein [Nonomuraea angiospora]
MKRVLAAAVAAAALLTAAPAQAAAPDPVRALEKQFVAGHGVKISEVSRMEATDEAPSTSQMTGTYAFGESGIVAADLTMRSRPKKSSPLMTFRFVIVDKQVYVQGQGLEKELPEGKTWVRLGGAANATVTSHPVDIFRPAALKGLLSHARSVKSGLYSGSLTSKQLSKLNASKSGLPMDYRLNIGPTGLPSRLRTSSQLDFGKWWVRETADTRYSAWGHKATIEAPPEEQVIDSKDIENTGLDEMLEALQLIPNEALASR